MTFELSVHSQNVTFELRVHSQNVTSVEGTFTLAGPAAASIQAPR